MRKILSFAAALLVTITSAVSCFNIDFPDDPYVPVSEDEAPAKFVPYETLYVSVAQGTASVVYLGKTKIATCYTSGNIVVPKLTNVTKASPDFVIVNIPLPEYSKAGIASENTMEMVVAFEDTKDGDHDYNDLVFQAHLDIVNNLDGTNTIDMELTPIAHGATKQMGLGIALYDDNPNYQVDFPLFDDCRASMFGGDEGFINTVTNEARKKYSPLETIHLTSNLSGGVLGLAWYITVGNERLYASNTFRKCLDNDDLPQGLLLMNLRNDYYTFEEGGSEYFCGDAFWQYPQEWINIETVYPDFNSQFISKGDFSFLANPVENSSYYDAIADVNKKVSESTCLYTLYSNGGETPSLEGVQLWDGGPKWATCNVGATSPEQFGLFFSWGNLDGYPCEGATCEHYFPYRPSDPDNYFKQTTGGGSRTTSIDKGDVAYDAAAFTYGGGWRLPTDEEYFCLVNQDFRAGAIYTTYEWVDDYKGTGVSGGLFTSIQHPERSIFLPAAGVIQGSIHTSGTGYAWTSTIEVKSDGTVNNARIVQFGKIKAEGKALTRSQAIPIRPVSD